MFENTAKALKKFDKTAPARAKKWDDANTDEAVKEAQAADLYALNLVRKAFYKDTKSINSPDNAAITTLDFMRSCVEKHGG